MSAARCISLGLERTERVHPRRSSGREVARQGGSTADDRGRSDESDGVERSHSIQCAADEVTHDYRARTTQTQAQPCDSESSSHDISGQAYMGCAQCAPYAQLTRLSRDEVR